LDTQAEHRLAHRRRKADQLQGDIYPIPICKPADFMDGVAF
jgi:hypothetical protein